MYVPEKLSVLDRMRLKSCIKLEEYQFEHLKKRCILIDKFLITFNPDYKEAYLYGYVRLHPNTNQNYIDNFFVRYEDSLLQADSLSVAIQIPDALRKEEAYQKYLAEEKGKRNATIFSTVKGCELRHK